MPTPLLMPSSSYSPIYARQKLQQYVNARSSVNDQSLPQMIALINQLIDDVSKLNNVVNSGSVAINTHVQQTVPPAHTFTTPPAP